MTEYSAGFQLPLGPGGLPIPPSADFLAGYQTFAATTAGTQVILVPTGRTWQGTIYIACSCDNAGANATEAKALCVMTMAAGGSVVPAVSPFMAVQALAGANVAAGTVGSQGAATLAFPWVLSAVGGNVQVIATVTITGTTGRVDVGCSGYLL